VYLLDILLIVEVLTLVLALIETLSLVIGSEMVSMPWLEWWGTLCLGVSLMKWIIMVESGTFNVYILFCIF
jgi:hypothetical protein